MKIEIIYIKVSFNTMILDIPFTVLILKKKLKLEHVIL